jgi:hippurate hydrolase
MVEAKSLFTRPEKTDFTALYQAHREILNKAGVNVEEMTKLRHHLHTHPEGGFKEFKTSAIMVTELKKYGLEDKWITSCAGTGLVVDIMGTAAPGKTNMIVALRTDLDGLPMPEDNPTLPYRSQTDHAHMCGHDGHMVTLLSAA